MARMSSRIPTPASPAKRRKPSTLFASRPRNSGARRPIRWTRCLWTFGKAILNPRETVPGQPRDETGPVFAEPWQAQAFALAVQLSEAGHFTWSEWSETLGAELRAAGQDDG